ncbi:MAG: carboxypeptidase regulatory-like domain-containing protein [Archangium sp.]|nr:carboxypeptidase regulatory-like domain-containing protein [Archangium sp.]
MQRRILIAAGLVFALALVFALWPSGPEGNAASESSEATPEALAPPVAKLLGGRVSGFVLRDGRPVSRARVSLKAAGPLVTLTLDDGRFLFEDVPSGQVYLAASTADAASEVVGPLQVTPSGKIEDVQLTLTPSVKIEGRVIDLLTQQPVVKATIISPTQASQTDEAGKFSLVGARTQTWIDVSAPGFLSRTEWVSLELASAGGKLELVLTPTSRLEGTVLESGTPVAAATVWAEVADGARRGDRTINVFTDKEGRYSLECAAGTLQLAAVTPSGIRVKGPLVRVAVGEKKTGITLDAGDVSSATGVVTRGGLPVIGAQVSAIDASTEAVSGLGTTGLNGSFRFDGLTLGKYVLQVRLGALMASAGPFDHRGDGMSWNVTLQAGGTLVGRVEPASAGVAVRWRSGTWSGPLAQTVTDATGHFRFEGLPDELLSVEAEGPAGAATARVKAGDDVVLVLKKGFVTVHLQDDTGAPVTDGVLVAKSLETGAARRQLVLAPDGVTRLDLSTGRWQLSLEVAGRGRSGMVDVTVTEAGAEVRLSLETSVVVSGRVADRSTGLPINGARVEAVSGDFGRGSRVSVLTDARGEFLLPPVARSGTIVVSHEGFAVQWRRVVDGARWEVALEPAAQQRKGPEFNQFEGVGMTLDGRSGSVMVTLVSEGSPAERAGVQAGDQILTVDGVAVAGQDLNTVVGRIRGPSGSPVVLRFQRGGQSFELTIRRRLLTL